MNELDWPHKGGYTGFEADSTDDPLRSVYKYMLARNKCNKHDYINIGVNGAESSDVVKNVKYLNRN